MKTPTENEYKLIELVVLLFDALKNSNALVPVEDLDKIAEVYDEVMSYYLNIKT